MNIFADSGHKVTVTEESLKNGYDYHSKTASHYLTVGETYTVKYTNVGDWHTDVYLNEIPNIAFNSVNLIDLV